MKKRIISKIVFYFLILSLINYIGCYSFQPITMEELNKESESSDLLVITKNKNSYKLFESDYTVKEDSIYGSGRLEVRKGIKVNEDYTGSIYLKDIRLIKIARFDVIGTFVLIAGGVGIMALIVSSIAPFQNDGYFK